jgi:hypothetical protein
MLGEALDEYIARLGWSQDPKTGVITIPANPDNQIEATVVRENIQLPRKSLSSFKKACLTVGYAELAKIIAHAQVA